MVNQQSKSIDIGFTHEDFAALLDKYDYHFSPGDIVAGTVFSLEPRGALIDIGAKTAAYIPIQEMSINRVDTPDEVLQSNETREFFILTDENEDGQLTLSIRRIEYMRAWERVRQLQAEDATVRSGVFATNRGGALVRIEGLRGFIPGSHISTRKAKEDLLGEELPLKFLEVDEDRNRLVLSHRRALVERKKNRLEVGEVVIGNVRGIKPYGAFIDIGGVSGLLHISEISHDHIETPHSVFAVNDELKVMIIDLDAERGRISLSTKQLEPEPGDMVKNPDVVYEKAEEMAAKYREQMMQKQQSAAAAAANAAANAATIAEEESIPTAEEPAEEPVEEIESVTDAEDVEAVEAEESVPEEAPIAIEPAIEASQEPESVEVEAVLDEVQPIPENLVAAVISEPALVDSADSEQNGHGGDLALNESVVENDSVVETEVQTAVQTEDVLLTAN